MSRLDDLKIANDRQNSRKEEQHDTILSEIRKENEEMAARKKNETVSPQRVQDDFPPINPNNTPSLQQQAENQNNKQGWEQDWIPVANCELEEPIDKEDPVRKLIKNNIYGFTTLYFTREKRGGIRKVRALIERQLQLGRVIKGLNFIGDEDKEVTEVVTLKKHATEIIATNDTLLARNLKNAMRRNILGRHLPDCNPYRPVWNALKEMTPQQQTSRTANHVRILTYQ